ncbi:acyl coA binding protein domain-containing protein [Purpureocillium lavendulum]|uniref:Acyl coA binding protein domain-containing protein n=1 Tax=Purpureocillium lavendulum TaxID=1247861 RepID=A0AB34FZM0_9HYPO|nr:acyl coA binding protein domain-containing protein [Purpureocillium lavendulum]
MSPPQSEAFQKAVVDSKKLTSKPSNDDLLDLYVPTVRAPHRSASADRSSAVPAALYKVAIGEDISKATAPGMFDLKASFPLPLPISSPRRLGKAKKNAWQKVVDEGITAEQAQERYVALVEKLKASCGYDENKEPEAVGN